MIRLLSFVLFLSTTSLVFPQSIIDELDETKKSGLDAPTLSTEKILKISNSKKIFILSNENNSFNQGDFISFVLEDNLVARALVAKDKGNLSGIKIVKIYSLPLWKLLRKNMQIEIIRGDDSYFTNLKKRKEKDSEDLLKDDVTVGASDDLYDATSFDDDLTVDEDKKRFIKPDNLVGATIGSIEGVDNSGASTRYTQYSVMWAYQIASNIFAEAAFGQNVVKDFPSSGLDTRVTNITVRGKYTFTAPFDSYIQPYLGYQIVTASSPGAGEEDTSGTTTQTDLDNEVSLVSEFEKNTIIFGATILKRLVPGWFFRADLGTDIFSAGFSLEF